MPMKGIQMKLKLVLIIAIFTNAYSSICRDRFLETLYYGYNESIRLDSANWDIQSQGGDRNIYIYALNGKILENIRITSSIRDTIKFQEISQDSLVWVVGGVLTDNWIKYGIDGSFITNYDDGYETIHSDTIRYSGDSTIANGSEQYSTDPVVTWSKIGYYVNTEFRVNYVNGNNLVEVNCQETSSSCNCELNNGTTTVQNRYFI
jgi:hypothetical protein